MKNSILVSICLVSLMNLSSTKSLAADDKYICRSTCVLIDTANSTIYKFGSASGKSEISTDEAFQVMEQDCKNKATARGFDGEATNLIRGIVQVSTDKIRQNTISTGNGRSFRLGFILDYSRSRSVNSLETHNTEDQFSYQVNFADESSCGPYVSNPDGKPKYIGPDTPLG